MSTRVVWNVCHEGEDCCQKEISLYAGISGISRRCSGCSSTPPKAKECNCLLADINANICFYFTNYYLNCDVNAIPQFIIAWYVEKREKLLASIQSRLACPLGMVYHKVSVCKAHRLSSTTLHKILDMPLGIFKARLCFGSRQQLCNWGKSDWAQYFSLLQERLHTYVCMQQNVIHVLITNVY